MEAVTVTAGTDGRLDIALRGEIDFTNAASVLQVIRDGIGPALSAVRVDLGAVTFLDSSGIGVLVQILNLADDRGAPLRVENPAPKVYDQLHMSGLTEVFGLPDSPPTAMT